MKNRSKILLVTLPVLACFAFLPATQACNRDDCDMFSTFQGEDALLSNTTGSGNTAFGWKTLFLNTDGSFSSAFGGGALTLNNGSSNTAVGAAALLLNTSGTENVAVGTDALVFNTIATDNNAVGAFALFNNDSSGLGSANFNNAHGHAALEANVDGSENNAFGDLALTGNVSGSFNTAIGDDALALCTADSNTAVGDEAGANLTTGSQNVYIGAGVSAGDPAETRFIRIGDTNFTDYDCFIAGIFGRTIGATNAAVGVDDTGKLGTLVSSRRFKHDIKPIDKTSEAILALKPVKFCYNSDPTNKPSFGLIAEDVADVNPDLIVRDKEGKPLTVRYDAVNAMLLNEFLKEHKRVEEQQASISQLKSEMRTMVAQLKEQAAQIQKVSAQLEVSKPAAKVVVNKP
jgi:hypothetical protein